MSACGFEVSSRGVAKNYGDILDIMVIDERDTAVEEDFDMKTVRFDTIMTSVEKSEALAKRIMRLLR
jgi:LPPG:FO 2-phospho-L-lactate transferase